MVIKFRSFNRFWFRITDSLFRFANFAFVLASFCLSLIENCFKSVYFILMRLNFAPFTRF
ncbi:unnamed protein product [Brassica rapa subsp. trilocularis]